MLFSVWLALFLAVGFYTLVITRVIVVVSVSKKEKFDRIVFVARVSRFGDGLMIWIPKAIRETYDIKAGQTVKVRLENLEQ